MTSLREIVAWAAVVAGLGGCGPPGLPPLVERGKPSAHAARAEPLVTVDGEVMGVDRVPTEDKLAGGIRVSLAASGRAPVEVHLAPGWYLDERGLKLVEREHVRVLGTPSVRVGRTTVVAWEVRKGGETYRLRDERGKPLWNPTAH
jgi:hypothetical protein